MKKLLFCALFMSITCMSVTTNTTPYGGSISGGGQNQRAYVEGYKYLPENNGPTQAISGGKRRYQGRIWGPEPSKRIYYSRYRYNEENPGPGSVHSRK